MQEKPSDYSKNTETGLMLSESEMLKVMEEQDKVIQEQEVKLRLLEEEYANYRENCNDIIESWKSQVEKLQNQLEEWMNTEPGRVKKHNEKLKKDIRICRDEYLMLMIRMKNKYI